MNVDRKSKIKFIFLALLSFALFGRADSSQAADHYVREGAAGANNGSDWTNAWTALPAALTRGDTYYIADGTYGSYTFDDAESGTSVITVKKAIASDHGTDTGWDNSYGDGTAIFSGISFASPFWVFDGVIGGGPDAWDSGYGFEITRSIPNLCRDNGNLITLGDNVSHITVSHVNMHPDDNDYPVIGIRGRNGADNLIFSHNWIHNIFGPAFHIGNWSNIIIEHNYIHDVRSTGSTDPRGFCNNWHSEGISSVGENDNISIRHNIWDSIGGTAVLAGVNIGTSTNWKVYGNIFSRSVSTVYYYWEDPGSNRNSMYGLRFYNNTIVGIPNSSVGGIAINRGSDNIVENNIWYDNIANSFIIDATHDYNYFNNNRRIADCPIPCEKNTQGASGEAHPQIATGSPFINYDPDPLASDYNLSEASSPGYMLAFPYNIDLRENTRGADGIWDRGAFEYVSGAPSDTTAPAAPSGLTVD